MVRYDDAMKALIHDALVRDDSPQEILVNLPIRQITVYDYRHNLLSLRTVAPPLCVMGTPPKPNLAARESGGGGVVTFIHPSASSSIKGVLVRAVLASNVRVIRRTR